MSTSDLLEGEPTRRDVTRAALTGVATALAGCSTDAQNPEGNEDPTETQTEQEPTLKQVVEDGLKPEKKIQFKEDVEVEELKVNGETYEEGEYAPEKAGEKEVELLANMPNRGDSYHLEGSIEVDKWEDFGEFYNEILIGKTEFPRNTISEDQRVLEHDLKEEIQEMDDVGKAMERIHVAITEEYEINNRKAYTNMMRKAANKEVGFNWQEALVNHIRGALGGAAAVVHRENPDGQDFYDVGVPFSREGSYLRDGEAYQIGSSEASLYGTKTDGRNPSNIQDIREAVKEAYEEGTIDESDVEERATKLNKYNDAMFPIPDTGNARIPGYEGPDGQITPSVDAGSYWDSLKFNMEFLTKGALAIVNNIGEDEYTRFEVADNPDELENRYEDKEPLHEPVKHEGKAFAPFKIDEQTFQQTVDEVYQPQ